MRGVVDRFGPNRRVVGIQVTNEVNLADSPDSSDGYYNGGRDALIQGVIAAKDEARRRGFAQLRIGFNWAYRNTPQNDQSFWDYLRDHGGPPFVAALDWIGLDAYPGTFIPPADTPGGEPDALVNAMSSLRCYARGRGHRRQRAHAGRGERLPDRRRGRSEQRQVQAMDSMIGAFNDFRGTYNVIDYRWFDLRDSDSTSQNFQQQYGLLHDDYSPKPAFAEYRRLIEQMSSPLAPGPGAPGGARCRPPAAAARALPARPPLARLARSSRAPAGSISCSTAGSARATAARRSAARSGAAGQAHDRRKGFSGRSRPDPNRARLRPGRNQSGPPGLNGQVSTRRVRIQMEQGGNDSYRGVRPEAPNVVVGGRVAPTFTT